MQGARCVGVVLGTSALLTTGPRERSTHRRGCIPPVKPVKPVKRTRGTLVLGHTVRTVSMVCAQY